MREFLGGGGEGGGVYALSAKGLNDLRIFSLKFT